MSRRTETLCILLLVALSFVTRALLTYGDENPEADAVLVAAGVALGATGTMPFPDTFLYGRQINPAVFLLMRASHPLLWNDPSRVLAILNWVSIACGALVLFPMYRLFRMRLAAPPALAALAIWALSPLVWDAQTYFHPHAPSVLFLMLAMVAFTKIDGSMRGAAWWVLTAFLGALAAMTRLDVVFAVPALVLLALMSTRRWRNVLLLAALGMFVVAVHSLTMRALAGDTATAGFHLTRFVRRWTEMYNNSFSLRGLPRSVAWCALGLGVATLGAVILGTVAMVRERGRRAVDGIALWAGLAWLVPPVVFWLPFIVPMLRHYYLGSMGLAWLCGLILLDRLGGKRLLAVTTAIVILNIAIPEALYRAYNAQVMSGQPAAVSDRAASALGRHAKTPHGTVFYYHELAAERLAGLKRLRRAVVAPPSAGDEAVRSLVVCSWETYAHVVWEIASTRRRVAAPETTVLLPGTLAVRYVFEGGEVRLVNYVYATDELARKLATETIPGAMAEQFRVFAPAAFAGLPSGVVPYR